MENINYSVNYPGFVILLRCVSSVPMHVFASGIMAYFLSYNRLSEEWRASQGWNRTARRKAFLLFAAFLVPWSFHGVYDYALFKSGPYNYLIPGHLILGYAVLEYFITRGRLVPGKNILDIVGLGADEMDIIQKEQEYEKWMRDFQKKAGDRISLFKNEWSLFNTASGLVLSLFAACMLFLFFTRPDLMFRGVSSEIRLSLLVLLPGAMAVILFVSDKVNFLFFRQNMLRQPEGNPVCLKKDDFETDLIVLDIFPGGVFLPGLTQFELEETLRLEFYLDDTDTIETLGRVQWVNQYAKEMPRGTLVRFSRTAKGFSRFLFQHNLRKVRNRILLNIVKSNHAKYIHFWD